MKKEYGFSKDVRGKCALNTYKRRYVAADDILDALVGAV